MDYKKKILILGKLPPPYYGVSVWYEQLQKGSWPTDYHMLWFDAGVHKDISTIGELSVFTMWKHMRLYLKYFKHLYSKKPDLVIIPISQSKMGIVKDSIYIFLAYLFRTNVLVMLHGSNLKLYIDDSSVAFKKYCSSVMDLCDGAIVLSEKLKYIFSEYFKLENIYSVPNGIDLPQFDRTSINLNPVQLVYLGNLIESKGILQVIQSLKVLQDMGINYRMKVAGSWSNEDFKSTCLDYCEKNNLNIDFLGVVTGTEKNSVLENSDIFLFTPSDPEGLPYVILEAMAHSLPIITTDKGAISDAVINNRNGFVLRYNKPMHIANKVKYLIDNPSVMIEMQKESLAIYRQNFTSKRMIDSFVNVIKHISV